MKWGKGCLYPRAVNWAKDRWLGAGFLSSVRSNPISPRAGAVTGFLPAAQTYTQNQMWSHSHTL